MGAQGAGNAAFVNAAAGNGIAIGNQAQVESTGTNALALGLMRIPNGVNAIAIGADAVSAANSTVIGPGATDNNFTDASVYGVNAQVGAAGNTAVGDSAIASGATAIAIGADQHGLALGIDRAGAVGERDRRQFLGLRPGRRRRGRYRRHQCVHQQRHDRDRPGRSGWRDRQRPDRRHSGRLQRAGE